jgi:hypothetical protein
MRRRLYKPGSNILEIWLDYRGYRHNNFFIEEKNLPIYIGTKNVVQYKLSG